MENWPHHRQARTPVRAAQAQGPGRLGPGPMEVVCGVLDARALGLHREEPLLHHSGYAVFAHSTFYFDNGCNFRRPPGTPQTRKTATHMILFVKPFTSK